MASQDRIRRKLRVPDEVVALIRGCHPQLKRKIRAGLLQIATEPESGKSLKDELEGFKSCRISRLRIIYRISSKQTIDIVAVGPRKTIYEETYKIIKKESNPQSRPLVTAKVKHPHASLNCYFGINPWPAASLPDH
ncbi:MAG: type II toxin-antitoxin system RelE/ParE family toxin [Desulfobacterales bacterium]